MAEFWNARSRAVALALLSHHRTVCPGRRAGTPVSDFEVARCTLTYDELRRSAKIGGIAQDIGRHLRKIAEWCQIRTYPPCIHLLSEVVVATREWGMNRRLEQMGIGMKTFAAVSLLISTLRALDNLYSGSLASATD